MTTTFSRPHPVRSACLYPCSFVPQRVRPAGPVVCYPSYRTHRRPEAMLPGCQPGQRNLHGVPGFEHRPGKQQSNPAPAISNADQAIEGGIGSTDCKSR